MQSPQTRKGLISLDWLADYCWRCYRLSWVPACCADYRQQAYVSVGPLIRQEKTEGTRAKVWSFYARTHSRTHIFSIGLVGTLFGAQLL